MKEELKTAAWLIGLGIGLAAYAHANFATKSTVETMDARIYEIWKEVVSKK